MRSIALRTTRQLVAQRSALTYVRCYLGGAGEGVTHLSPQEEELLKLAKPRYDEMHQRHVRLPRLDRIPSSSLDPSQSSQHQQDLELEIRRKRLIYRSKQRGWLEVDLLLGTWASQHVARLNDDELDQFESFVNMETVDIYNIVTLRSDVPEHLQTADKTGIAEKIQAWARASPLGKADPEQYKAVKTDAKLI